MAKTQYKKYVGKCAWAMLYTPDEYNGKSFWKISFYPDIDTLLRMKEDGVSHKVREDDGGSSGVAGKYFTFRRDCEKDFGNGVQAISPPAVYDKNKKALVSYKKNENEDAQYAYDRIGEPVLIGNGSEVEITLEIYNTRSFGKQARFNSVRIIDLIHYDPDGDDDAEEAEEQVPTEHVKVTNKKNSKVPF